MCRRYEMANKSKYPTSSPAQRPGLLPDVGELRALSVRQRCYYYRGSATVYTNTITIVYEREIKINHGLNYSEALFKELKEAWENELTTANSRKDN